MVTNSSACSHFGASVSSAFLFLSVFGSVSVRGVIHEPAAVPLPSRWRADVDVTTGLPHEARIPRWSDSEPSDGEGGERERWERLHEDEDVVPDNDKQARRGLPLRKLTCSVSPFFLACAPPIALSSNIGRGAQKSRTDNRTGGGQPEGGGAAPNPTRTAAVWTWRATTTATNPPAEQQSLHDAPGILRDEVGTGKPATRAAFPTETTEAPVPPPPVWSVGSEGHPHSCSSEGGCKYANTPRGCKEGANCTRCHLCRYKMASRSKRPPATTSYEKPNAKPSRSSGSRANAKKLYPSTSTSSRRLTRKFCSGAYNINQGGGLGRWADATSEDEKLRHPEELRSLDEDEKPAVEVKPLLARAPGGSSSACGDLRGQLVAPSSSSVQILGLASVTYCWVPACGMMAGSMIGPAMPQCSWFVSCGNQGRFVTAGFGSPALDPVAGGAQFPPPSGPHNFPAAEMSFYCTPAWGPSSPYPAQQTPSTYSPGPHEDTVCVGGRETREPGAGSEQASSPSCSRSCLVEATLLEDPQPAKSRSAAATAATKGKENQICGRIPLAEEFSERIGLLGRPGVQREQLQQEQEDFFRRHGALNRGSQGHWEARCRPCGFRYRIQGCQVDDCGFCHACGDKAMKLQKKARVFLLRGG